MVPTIYKQSHELLEMNSGGAFRISSASQQSTQTALVVCIPVTSPPGIGHEGHTSNVANSRSAEGRGRRELALQK